MYENNLLTTDKKENAHKLFESGEKLLSKRKTLTKSKQYDPELKTNSEVDFEFLNTLLLDIENISSPQSKGYAFKKYLNSLFKSFNFDPHAVYRTEHDQIDGSFVLDGNTILIEAKYRTNPIPKDDLILFSRKIE